MWIMKCVTFGHVADAGGEKVKMAQILALVSYVEESTILKKHSEVFYNRFEARSNMACADDADFRKESAFSSRYPILLKLLPSTAGELLRCQHSTDMT